MNEERRFTFTVFTATYDRVDILPRLKASLEAQTFSDFEWLIVDDGSTDGTSVLIESWLESSPLEIRYIRQNNAGKHVAFNRGVREARGDLFLTLDSDDECSPEALARLLHHWESIPLTERSAFSAVTALCLDADGNLVGKLFPCDPYDADSLQTYFSGAGRGEKWGFQRTDVLRQFPFPEPPGVKFVAESVVWFAIARHYKTRYVNEPLRIYHADVIGSRLSDLNRETAYGRLIFHRDVITKYIDFLPKYPGKFIRSSVNYCRYSFHCGEWPYRQLLWVDSMVGKILVVACMAPGAVAYAFDLVFTRSAEKT